MSRVIDLSAHGRGGGPYEPLKHPAGVSLPFDGPSDAALIIPEVRSEIRSGAYDADVIALLAPAVRPGDRVLVIGAGLGVVSTLIARREEVERVIAVEANTALITYLERTHALNGVERVETLNAVLAEGKKGRVPFFARRDLRNSSLLPHDRSWQQVMMVPFMDLNLILSEERITLVVSETPTHSADLLARAELGPVERILLNAADDPSGVWEDEGVCAALVSRGYVPEVLGSAVLFRRADALTAPGAERRGAAAEPVPEDGFPEVGEDTDEDSDEDGGEDSREDSREDGEAALAEGPKEARATGEAPPSGKSGPGEGGSGESWPPARREPQPSAAPAEEAVPAGRAVRRDEGPAEPAGARPVEPASPAASEGEAARPPAGEPASRDGSRRLWGLVAIALLLALPLMLIGQLAGERGGSRMAAMQELGAAWGGPQTLTGPFLLVPVRDAAGAAAEPLVILPETLEATTAMTTGDGRADARGAADYAAADYGALVYRSRSEVRLGADVGAAEGLLAPDETALWSESRLGLGIREPAALGAAYLLGGAAENAGFVAGSGAEALPGIHVPLGDPRGRETALSFVLELDGWRLLRLTPSGGTTVWRIHGDWPHPAFRGPFRPAVKESGGRGFVAHWQIPEAAVALPRVFRGTGPLTGLEALAVGVELVPPLDLYRTIERGAKFGLMVIALTFGAVLLLERSAGRAGRVVHYALIGAAQCAFFLLLLPLAERVGFRPAYAIAAAATTALLTIYAWSALGLGSRAGWVALALAALYGVMYPVLAAREHTLLMGAVIVFLVLAGLMWATRNGGEATGGPLGRSGDTSGGTSGGTGRGA